MLTDRGWAVSGIGAGLIVLWVLLGEIELLGAGTVALAGVGFSILITRLRSPRVNLIRRLAPSYVHEGDRATVQVNLTNQASRPLGNVTLVDEVGELGSAEFQIGAMRRKATLQASYQILCRPRGVYPVGPATLRISDPMGLAAVESRPGSGDRLVVYPAVEELAGFPMTRGRDPAVHASRPEFNRRGGEDFFTLREYVLGDDLRFVHWPSSAKRDDLMIRQLETPWQSRALIIFDLRAASFENLECFEKAVRGAASVIRHLSHTGFDAELWAGGGTTTSLSHYAAVMEQLAQVQPESNVDIKAVAARMRRTGRGGALVLVTGTPDHELFEVHRLLSREYRTTAVLSVSETTSSSVAAFHRAGALMMNIEPSGSWAEVWSRSVRRGWIGASAG